MRENNLYNYVEVHMNPCNCIQADYLYGFAAGLFIPLFALLVLYVRYHK